jgi:hypothetical protein
MTHSKEFLDTFAKNLIRNMNAAYQLDEKDIHMIGGRLSQAWL